MSALIRSSRPAWNPAPWDRLAIATDRGWPRSPRAGQTDRLATDGPGRLAKRVLDVVGAWAGLMLLGPVMLVLALLIRLDSPGPVLFRQVRRGSRGRPFRMLKFRTMVADAEARLADLESCNESAGGVLFKLRDDPRVTRLGRFLRRSSLDELPQLINVREPLWNLPWSADRLRCAHARPWSSVGGGLRPPTGPDRAGSADRAASYNRTDPVGSDRAGSSVGTPPPRAREPRKSYAL